jgi:hypothetical protein
VLATKPKSAVAFYVNRVARFTFFGREDRFDRSNKLITRWVVNFIAYGEFCVHGESSRSKAGRVGCSQCVRSAIDVASNSLSWHDTHFLCGVRRPSRAPRSVHQKKFHWQCIFFGTNKASHRCSLFPNSKGNTMTNQKPGQQNQGGKQGGQQGQNPNQKPGQQTQKPGQGGQQGGGQGQGDKAK